MSIDSPDMDGLVSAAIGALVAISGAVVYAYTEPYAHLRRIVEIHAGLPDTAKNKAAWGRLADAVAGRLLEPKLARHVALMIVIVLVFGALLIVQVVLAFGSGWGTPQWVGLAASIAGCTLAVLSVLRATVLAQRMTDDTKHRS